MRPGTLRLDLTREYGPRTHQPKEDGIRGTDQGVEASITSTGPQPSCSSWGPQDGGVADGDHGPGRRVEVSAGRLPGAGNGDGGDPVGGLVILVGG
jgi:hypothetical protein